MTTTTEFEGTPTELEEPDLFEEAGLEEEPVADTSPALLGVFTTRGSHETSWVDLETPAGDPVPGAQLCIARAKNEEYTDMINRAARKYGNRRGEIPHEVLQWLQPTLYAKTLLVAIRGIRLGDVASVPDVSVWIKPRGTKVPKRVTQTVAFSVGEDGYLVDTEDNRTKLLQVFPEIQEQVFLAASDYEKFILDEDAEKN